MAEWETVSFPLVKGIETAEDDLSVPAPDLVVAENVYADKAGALRKRKGTTALSTLTVDNQSLAASNPAALARYKQSLMMIDAPTVPNVYEYSETAARWTEHGTYAPGVLTSQGISTAGNGRSIWQVDCATGNGYTLIAQIEDGVDDGGTFNSTVRVTLQDAFGTFVCNRMQVFTNGSGASAAELLNLRVVYLSSKFYVFFGDNVNSDLLVWLLDVTSPATITTAINTSGGGSVTSPVTVATDLHTTTLRVFDAIASGTNGVFLCYKTTTPNELKFGFVNASGTLASTSTIAGVIDATYVAVTAQSASLHGIAYSGASVYAAIRSWSGAAWTATATSAAMDAAAAGFLACRFDSATVLRVWYNSGAIGSSVVYQSTFTTGGTITSRTLRLRKGYLASRPFVATDANLYFWSVDGLRAAPITQPTHFLVNSATGLPVAQANVGTATTNLLTTVAGGSAGGFVTALMYLLHPTNGSMEFDDGLNVGTRLATWWIEHDQSHKVAEVGESLLMAGGLLQQYDGNAFTESNFLRIVENDLITLTPAATGSMTASALYYYRFIPARRNARGELDLGTDNGPKSVTLGAGDGKVTAVIPTIIMTRSRRTNSVTGSHQIATSDIVFLAYRSGPNPATSKTPFYYVGQVANTTSADTVSFVDTMADATAATNEGLYLRTGELDHVAPPPAHIMCEGAGRVFLAGLPDAPNEIRYSLLRQPGDGVAFNDALTILVPEQGGAITALAVLNDTLIVLKERAIYRVRGTGADNLGNGGYFDPEMISPNIGCVGQRGVAVTTFGVMFQSPLGFHLVDPNHTVAYIGQGLEGLTGTDAPTNTVNGCVVLPMEQQVRFTAASRMWVFDYNSKIWTLYTGQGVSGPSVEWNDAHAWPASTCLYENVNNIYTAADCRIVLAWARLGPTMQEAIRFRRLGLTGTAFDGIVNIRVKLYVNYDYTTVRQTIPITSIAEGVFAERKRTKGGCRVVSALRVEIDDNGSTLGSLSLNEVALELKRRDTGEART